MSEIFLRQAKAEDRDAIAGFNKAMALETEGKELSEAVAAGGQSGFWKIGIMVFMLWRRTGARLWAR
jgi:hypothetical protein